MSAKISVIPAAAAFDQRVTPQQLRVLVIVSSYGAVKDRGCWPSYNRLAEDVGISRRLLIGYIKNLCDCGYLIKEPRSRNDGSSSSNRYRINIDISTEVQLGDARQHQASAAVLDGIDANGQHSLEMNNKTLTNKKIENTKKKSKKVTLAEWEAIQGSRLCIDQISDWVKAARAHEGAIRAMIVEFRDVMTAGGNEYADFAAAFKNYMRRGYLSKRIDQIRVKAPSGEAEIWNVGIRP